MAEEALVTMIYRGMYGVHTYGVPPDVLNTPLCLTIHGLGMYSTFLASTEYGVL